MRPRRVSDVAPSHPAADHLHAGAAEAEGSAAKAWRRIRTRGAGLTDETGETEETGDGSRTTQPRSASALPQQQSPIESAERRVPSPNGKLSDDTLKAMLEVQEKDGEDSL